MNKNGGAEFLEQDATIERLANNQPTSSVARVIVLTRMASALSRSCLTFAYSSPGTALLSDSPKSAHANRRILLLNFTLTVFTCRVLFPRLIRVDSVTAISDNPHAHRLG